jgi:RNA polymerase sigma-70 factor (ECF subfamily)
VIRGAAAGDEADRERFARRYTPVVRAYLGARWRRSFLIREIDDAVQEVFLDCFRDGGALERLDPGRSGGFRAFFFGVVRNVALRVERNAARDRVRPGDGSFDPERLAADETSLGAVFDRAWATAILKEAGHLQARRAEERDSAACRRIELLRLRFQESLPIREIALRWDADPAHLHHEYAKARREFREALIEVVSFHHPDPTTDIPRECARLLDLFR